MESMEGMEGRTRSTGRTSRKIWGINVCSTSEVGVEDVVAGDIGIIGLAGIGARENFDFASFYILLPLERIFAVSFEEHHQGDVFEELFETEDGSER